MCSLVRFHQRLLQLLALSRPRPTRPTLLPQPKRQLSGLVQNEFDAKRPRERLAFQTDAARTRYNEDDRNVVKELLRACGPEEVGRCRKELMAALSASVHDVGLQGKLGPVRATFEKHFPEDRRGGR